jgi:hypothetical protein
MKVTIDLDKLLQEGKINQAEYDKFTQFSARGTTALAFNILVGFGVVGVSWVYFLLTLASGSVLCWVIAKREAK